MRPSRKCKSAKVIAPESGGQDLLVSRSRLGLRARRVASARYGRRPCSPPRSSSPMPTPRFALNRCLQPRELAQPGRRELQLAPMLHRQPRLGHLCWRHAMREKRKPSPRAPYVPSWHARTPGGPYQARIARHVQEHARRPFWISRRDAPTMGFRERLELILQARPRPRRTSALLATVPKGIAALAGRYQAQMLVRVHDPRPTVPSTFDIRIT